MVTWGSAAPGLCELTRLDQLLEVLDRGRVTDVSNVATELPSLLSILSELTAVLAVLASFRFLLLYIVRGSILFC